MVTGFSNFLEYFKALRRPEWTPKEMPLALSAEGITFPTASGEAVGIAWADIDGIATWKYDNFLYDEIVLGFHRKSVGDWVVVSEEQPGFMDVSAEMQRRFPTIPDSWYFDVMQPTFETKLTLLYGTHRPWPADQEELKRGERR